MSYQPIPNPLPVSGSVTATDAAAEASLAAVNAKTPALGAAAMAGSTPVAIASDQTRIPVTADATTKAAISLAEQVDMLVAAQVATVHLLGQILAACRGQAAPLPSEEADPLIGEFMDGRAAAANIMN